MVHDIIPDPIKSYIVSAFTRIFSYFFTPLSTQITMVVDENNGMMHNQIYESVEHYLHTKISPKTKRFKESKNPKKKNISLSMEKNELAKEIKEKDKNVKLYTRDCPHSYSDDGKDGGNRSGVWGCVNLDHPVTFEKSALPAFKGGLVDGPYRAFYKPVCQGLVGLDYFDTSTCYGGSI
ncbi:P-loop containing nucleoside triphosphate hydrolase superfamily protein [Forsythia ovata]|uniref:P-loop containing nucleoside triphosphate hydrolase superfamily protein n=1 Tax=Forsythia ovata TaxID=205694 RepID=A0ABD1SIT2_9LAMI